MPPPNSGAFCQARVFGKPFRGRHRTQDFYSATPRCLQERALDTHKFLRYGSSAALRLHQRGRSRQHFLMPRVRCYGNIKKTNVPGLLIPSGFCMQISKYPIGGFSTPFSRRRTFEPGDVQDRASLGRSHKASSEQLRGSTHRCSAASRGELGSCLGAGKSSCFLSPQTGRREQAREALSHRPKGHLPLTQRHPAVPQVAKWVPTINHPHRIRHDRISVNIVDSDCSILQHPAWLGWPAGSFHRPSLSAPACPNLRARPVPSPGPLLETWKSSVAPTQRAPDFAAKATSRASVRCLSHLAGLVLKVSAFSTHI